MYLLDIRPIDIDHKYYSVNYTTYDLYHHVIFIIIWSLLGHYII